MARNKAQILFTCTEEFKEALATYAQQKNVSVAVVIRETVAARISYDLSSEELNDGRRKYANAEERRLAQAKKKREDRDNLAKLVALYEREKKLQDIIALETSLTNRGVSLDD